MNIKTLDENDIDAFVAFIENFQNDSRSEEFWKSRIINWWKENPAFEKECIRGWVLLDNQKIFLHQHLRQNDRLNRVYFFLSIF